MVHFAGGSVVFVVSVFVVPFVFGVAILVGALVTALWCVWDRPDRQNLWDKICSTHVTYSPSGFRPPGATMLHADSDR